MNILALTLTEYKRMYFGYNLAYLRRGDMVSLPQVYNIFPIRNEYLYKEEAENVFVEYCIYSNADSF